MSDKSTCYIYRCSRKQDTYIYLSEKDDFSSVPDAVMNGLGLTEFALELEIDENTRLAKEDPKEVLDNLSEHGFHIQLADNTPIEELMARLARETSHH